MNPCRSFHQSQDSYRINFLGKNVPCTHKVKVENKTKWDEIMREVSEKVDQVRDVILEARNEPTLITLILPDNGVMAVAIVQAVRG
jgi:hypothetical protein